MQNNQSSINMGGMDIQLPANVIAALNNITTSVRVVLLDRTAELAWLQGSGNVDTSSGVSTSALAVSLVQFSAQWSKCRQPPPGTTLSSGITRIEVSTSGTGSLHVSNLGTPILFTLVATPPPPSAISNSTGEGQCTMAPAVHGGNDTQGFHCAYWNDTARAWLDHGCINTGVTKGVNGTLLIHCSCNHLTGQIVAALSLLTP